MIAKYTSTSGRRVKPVTGIRHDGHTRVIHIDPDRTGLPPVSRFDTHYVRPNSNSTIGFNRRELPTFMHAGIVRRRSSNILS